MTMINEQDLYEKVDLRICGGEHKVTTLEEVQAVTTLKQYEGSDGSLYQTGSTIFLI